MSPLQEKHTKICSAISSSPQKILVIDAEASTRVVVRKILEKSSYEVYEADNGTEALHFLKDTIPDLILLEIFLPDIDGYKVCHKIKSDSSTQEIPILFISSFTKPEDEEKAFNHVRMITINDGENV